MIQFPLILLEVDRLVARVKSLTRRRRIRALLADFSVVDQLKHLRHNVVNYAARYPKATKLRKHLGDEIWEQLELYRLEVAKLAFLTRSIDRQRRSGVDAIPNDAHVEDAIGDLLDWYIPELEMYIFSKWGEEKLLFFLTRHYALQSKIEIDMDGIDERQKMDIVDAVRGGWIAAIEKMCRRQPIYWLVYNFCIFPVARRRTWPQLARWAIRNLRQRDVMEPPAWCDIRLRYMGVSWDPLAIANAIWKRAELEAMIDIERRFTSLGPWAY